MRLRRIGKKKVAALAIVLLLLFLLVTQFAGLRLFSILGQEETTYIYNKADLTDYELDLLDSILLDTETYDDPFITDDSYISDEAAERHINFNTQNLWTDSGSGDSGREIMIKMDFSDIYYYMIGNSINFNDLINSVKLEFTSISFTRCEYWDVYDTEPNWDESTVTYANKPNDNYRIDFAPDGGYATEVCPSVASIDLTDYIRTEFSSGHYILSIRVDQIRSTLVAKFYDKESSFGPEIVLDTNIQNQDKWVEEGITIHGGFARYTGVSAGTRIEKISAVIAAEYPSVVYEGETFEVDVSTGSYQDSAITIKLISSSNQEVGTYTGVVSQAITIPDCPLTPGIGKMLIMASRDGQFLIEEKSITVNGLDLLVQQPAFYEIGKTFDLGVRFTDPSISRPVSVEFYSNGLLVGSYSGNMPTVTIDNPTMTGDVTMKVTATYMGRAYVKTYSISFDPIILSVIQPGTYRHGLTTSIQLSISGHPEITNAVQVTFKKDDQVLEQYQGTMPTINIVEPRVLGTATMEVVTNYLGKQYIREIDVFFEGNPIVTVARAETYVQYEHEPIVFYVDVSDINGEYLTPKYISNIEPVCTLSQGDVSSSTYEHLGDGTYKITSYVSGVGNFIGKLAFTYLGASFESDLISINIEENSLSVSTSGIPPSAQRYSYFTGSIEVFDPLGNRIDPDDIHIDVSYPDGISHDYITYTQLQRQSTGIYTFTYRPTQLERYTFEVTASTTGITTATSVATVNVYDKSDDPAQDNDFVASLLDFILHNIWIFIIAFIIIIVLIWRFFR